MGNTKIIQEWRTQDGVKEKISQGRRSYLSQAIWGIGINVINDKIKFYKQWGPQSNKVHEVYLISNTNKTL